MIPRREFITLLSGAAAAWPVVVRAQHPFPVIGVLGSGSLALRELEVAAFRQGLAETGYVEGRNVTIEYRWDEDGYRHSPALAAELVQRQVSLIVTMGGTPHAQAAKAITSIIPIVFLLGTDPVAAGLVTNLARPAENLTGITSLTIGLAGKRLEVLRDLFPKVRTVGYLLNPNSSAARFLTEETELAARSLGIEALPLPVQNDGDLNPAFDKLSRQPSAALVVGGDQFHLSRRQAIISLAARHATPAVYASRPYVTDGGLMSYGTNIGAGYLQLGSYAGRVLKGEKPVNLPVLQSEKFELLINLKTAKALGLEVPLTMLYRADEVIE